MTGNFIHTYPGLASAAEKAFIKSAQSPVEGTTIPRGKQSPLVPGSLHNAAFASAPLNGRLLIVDDEPAQVADLCQSLAGEGYKTVCLSSAAEALAVLREQEFDLVVTDLAMPGMDGMEFLRAARKIDPDLVGIVIAAQSTADLVAGEIGTDALDFIVKPFRLSAVLPVLARALSVRRLRLQNIHLQQAVGIYELSMVIRLTLDFDAVLQKVADAAMGHTQLRGVCVLV
ncbi:MAG TPA: response regulator, partial [Bryobacteraceae bacterium]|nr:response regulator [Bryobacteraceae bacterium]